MGRRFGGNGGDNKDWFRDEEDEKEASEKMHVPALYPPLSGPGSSLLPKYTPIHDNSHSLRI
jgi:hypothetical protein